MCKYAVIYSSVTGNTEKIAATIYQAIPSTSKDICKIEDFTGSDFADNYFVGFNIDNGTAPEMILNFLKNLHSKNIALFATYGYSSNKIYQSQLANNISKLPPKDNHYLGCFLCQGKMPIAVRKKYSDMLVKDSTNKALLQLIENFDTAMLHPNTQDEENATEFVQKIMNKMTN